MQEKRKTIESIIKETFENGSDRFKVALMNAEVAEVLIEGIKATAVPNYKDPLLILGDAMLYLHSIIIRALKALGLKVKTDDSKIYVKGSVPIYTRRAHGHEQVQIDFVLELDNEFSRNIGYYYWFVPKSYLERLWHICEFVAFVVLSLSFENHPEHLRAVGLSDELINELCALDAA